MKKIIALLLILCVAGCVQQAPIDNDMDSEETGESIKETDTESDTRETDTDQMEVSIGFQALTLGHAPAQMMAQENTMYTIGVDPVPKINDLPGGVTIINALSSGEINMVYGGWGFIIPVIKGLPAKIVAGIANGGNSLVCNDESIKSVADLKGKTVAVHGQMSTQATVLRLAATEAGLDLEEDLDIVIVDRPSQVIALTEKKSVDCIVVGEPVVSKAVEAGAFVSVPHTELYKDNGFPETWVFARTDLIENNPEAIEKVLSAHGLAVQSLVIDTENAADVLASYYTEQGLETDGETVGSQVTTYSYTSEIDTELIADTISFLYDQGLIEDTIAIEDLVDCSFGYCLE